MAAGSIHTNMTRLAGLIGALFFLFAFIYSYKTNALFTDSDVWAVCFGSAACALFILLVFVIRRLTKARFMWSLLIVAASVRTVWIVYADTPPASDFLDMYTAAVSAAGGDYSFTGSDYYLRWAYQLGFTMYEAMVIKLFGSDTLVLQALNVVFSTATALLLYAVGLRVYGELCGRVAAAVYALYVPYIVMCSVLTNQHISTFLFFLGCYLFVTDGPDRSYRWLWVGLCFGFGHVMRPVGTIFITGLTVYMLLFQLWSLPKENRWPQIRKLLGIAIVYAAVLQAASFAFIQAGITEHPLKSREPYWKFVIGLNHETGGLWSKQDEEAVQPYRIGEERNRAELAIIEERLAAKRRLIGLFAAKFQYFWGREDASVFWSLLGTQRQELHAVLQQIETAMYMAMAVFGLIAMSATLAGRVTAPSWLLWLIMLLGYAVLHLVIEIQTRYRFDMMPSWIILQSIGVCAAYGGVRIIWRKMHMRKKGL